MGLLDALKTDFILSAEIMAIALAAMDQGSIWMVAATLAYYNSERPQSTHGILTPDEAYERKTEPTSLAA